MTEAQKKASRKYQKKLFKVTLVFFPKEHLLQKRVEEAVLNGQSKSEYIKSLIKKDLKY